MPTAVEDHDYPRAAPILVIAQLFDQRFTSQGRAPVVEELQFRPGKDNAVTVDEKIIRPHCRP